MFISAGFSGSQLFTTLCASIVSKGTENRNERGTNVGMRNLIQWLFNTAAKPLKYLPSYSVQAHTLQDAKHKTALQNGLKDFTFPLQPWSKNATEFKSQDVRRESGNGDLHAGPAGDGRLLRVVLFPNEATFQG